MARGITQDQVTKAADALLARGERPTIEKVRAQLGTGSPNTLLRLLDVWWAELAARLASQARAQLPDLPESVQRAMMTLWSEAVVVARSEEERQYKARHQALLERENAVSEQVAQQSHQVLAHEQSEAQFRQRIDSLSSELASERLRAEQLQQSLSTAVQALSDAQTTLVGLRQTNEEIRQSLKLDRERAESTEQRWLREVDRAREETKHLRGEVRAAQTQLATETRRRQRLESELSSLRRQRQTTPQRRSQSSSVRTTQLPTRANKGSKAVPKPQRPSATAAGAKRKTGGT